MPLAIRRIQSCPEKVVELAEQIVLDLHRQGFWLSAARGLTFVPSDAVELIHELELSPEDCTEYNEAVAAFWHQPAHLDHGELKLSAAAKLHTLMDKAVELMASQLAARELEAEKEP